MHEPAIQLHGQEELAWHDIALGDPPDLSTHPLAGGVLLMVTNPTHLDRSMTGLNR